MRNRCRFTVGTCSSFDYMSLENNNHAETCAVHIDAKKIREMRNFCYRVFGSWIFLCNTLIRHALVWKQHFKSTVVCLKHFQVVWEIIPPFVHSWSWDSTTLCEKNYLQEMIIKNSFSIIYNWWRGNECTGFQWY